MPRRIDFTVTPEYNNRKVAGFLHESARLSSRLLRSLKRSENGIMLNGKRAFTADLLKTGDRLSIELPDEEPTVVPEKLPIDILYEDADILVVNKSPFMAMHPTHNHLGGTLANAVMWHIGQKNTMSLFRAVGRLDKGTSGVAVCALNRYAASALAATIKKEYLAVVPGAFTGSGTIDAPLSRPDPMKTLRTCGGAGEKAVTHWTALGTDGKISLLRVTLETGRTHQIRVHFAHIGAPLIGDEMYGGSMPELGHHLLHCHKAGFTHPVSGEHLALTASMPADMARIAGRIVL